MLISSSAAVVGLVLCLGAAVQPLDPLLLLGDRLLADGLADEAITEYRRYLFFSRDVPAARTAQAHARIAFAYRGEGQHDKAVESLLEAIAAAADEGERDQWRVDLGVTEMARGRYDLAEFTLLKVEMFSGSGTARARAAFFRGIAGLYVGNVTEARLAFRTYADASNGAGRELGQRISRLLDDAGRRKGKSLRLAKALSSVVPGLGEVYAGDVKGGAGALAANAWAAFVLAQDVIHRQFFDALVGSTAPVVRFYRANRERAVAAARRSNEARGRALVDEILKLVEQR